MIVRRATEADWPAIEPFCHRILHEQETYCWDTAATPDQERDFWMGPHSTRITVATEGDSRVVGSAKMGPNRPGQGAHMATASFLVDPEAQGSGVGAALGRDVIAWATDEGFAGIQFNAVVESNTRAVSLWQRLGFRIIGTYPDAFDSPTDGRVGLHVMHRDLP